MVGAGTFAGTTRITIPDGVTVQGTGMDSSWLQNDITFGSNCTVRDIKIGTAAYSVQNRANASSTLFGRCRLRGGGTGEAKNCVVRLGTYGSCDHITFKDCLVERNLGIEDSSYSRGYNNIGCLENGATASGSHLDSITFIGCHIGVSNGRTDIPRNIGCPRMSMEFYTAEIPGVNRAYHGWSNVEVIDCVFEASDMCCIDLADTLDASGQHISGPALIRGCTLKGGGYDGKYWGYTICCEAPKGVVIENNTFYRAHDITLTVEESQGVDTSGYVIRNNVFALYVDNGITPGTYSMVLLRGSNHVFTGNTITTNSGSTVLELEHSSNSTITGNTLNELRSSNTPWAMQIWNVTGATISGNTFRTAATTDPVIHHSGTNSNNTLSGNVFPHN